MLQQDDKGHTKLYKAAWGGRLVEIQEILMSAKEAGIIETLINKASGDGDTPAYISSQMGHLQVVKILLDNNADINKSNFKGWTALMAASKNGHLDIVNLLLEYNADINSKNITSETALFLAAANGHENIVVRLVEADAQIIQPNHNNYSPLHIAVATNRKEVVKYLLTKSITKTILNEESHDNHHTPLTLAIKGKDQEMVQWLVSEGADVTLKGGEGKTPREWAKQEGQKEIKEYLKSCGASKESLFSSIKKNSRPTFNGNQEIAES